jgi:hypothetical protein
MVAKVHSLEELWLFLARLIGRGEESGSSEANIAVIYVTVHSINSYFLLLSYKKAASRYRWRNNRAKDCLLNHFLIINYVCFLRET